MVRKREKLPPNEGAMYLARTLNSKMEACKLLYKEQKRAEQWKKKALETRKEVAALEEKLELAIKYMDDDLRGAYQLEVMGLKYE